MRDERLRELERLAAEGDPEAAEELYAYTLRTTPASLMIDMILERLLDQPSAEDKRRFLAGLPPAGRPVDVEYQRRFYSTVKSGADLHRIPRWIRKPGYYTYVEDAARVYTFDDDSSPEAVCALRRPPPKAPFFVVDTLAERDALDPGPGCSCLVLANGGVYVSGGLQGPNAGNRNYRTSWREDRFERIARP